MRPREVDIRMCAALVTSVLMLGGCEHPEAVSESSGQSGAEEVSDDRHVSKEIAERAVPTSLTPLTVENEAPFEHLAQVSAGSGLTCAIEDNGRTRCWGDTEWGDGGGIHGAHSQISVGQHRACGVGAEGRVSCWGHQGATHLTPPTDIDAASKPEVERVVSGGGFGCVLREDGSVTCWGGASNVPEVTFEQVSAGDTHVCGVATGGQVHCWGGSPGSGILEVPNAGFRQVSVGRSHACGVTERRSVECWGSNEAGQLDVSDGRFVQVSAGGYHSCALTPSAEVDCWGAELHGHDYAQATEPDRTFVQVSAGRHHSCAVTADGAFDCWGRDSSGESSVPGGDTEKDDVIARRTPVRSPQDIAPGSSMDSLTAGAFHTCAKYEGQTGFPVCWGLNIGGAASAPDRELADIHSHGYRTCGVWHGKVMCWGGSKVEVVDEPVRTLQRLSDAGYVTSVAVGTTKTCALYRSPGVMCETGDQLVEYFPDSTLTGLAVGEELICGVTDEHELLCEGSGSAATPPGRIPRTVEHVSIARNRACVVTRGGWLKCWNMFDGESLTEVPGKQPADEVSVGRHHVCIVDDAQKIRCWGESAQGQLDAPDREFVDVKVGRYHTCGITGRGKVVCWGAPPAISHGEK